MATAITSRQLTNVSFEQEQDANSALTELDKALRSGQIGIQCEAVVKFPRLFEKYPFPILINSAMLKIADLFRGGNNFIRLCILRVTQQSEKHLDKIFSVDEFTRRIFGVIHSNDPVARAITLRALGSVASIISEKKNVHHSIILSLDSHNTVEVEAAVFAAEKFSEKSKTFAANVCSKIGVMISGLATPTEMKLRLIPILQHMHHDTETANKAIDLCQSVLTNFPAKKFITLTLQTLTRLTIKSLPFLQDHVLRLLFYLNTDPRSSVKAVCLDSLRLLAQRAAYLWTANNLEELANFALKTSSSVLKAKILHVLNSVCGNVAITLLTLQPGSSVIQICYELCYASEMELAVQAIRLITHLAKFKCFESSSDLTAEAVGAIQTHVMILVNDVDIKKLRHLKLILKCAVDICLTNSEISDKMVQTLTSLLGVSDEMSQLHLCECLAAIGSDCPSSLNTVTPQILASLTTTISQSSCEVSQVQVHMCTLLFEAGCQKPLSTTIYGQVMACISQANHWVAYKVARQAMRYSQYQVAYGIFKTLNLKVVTEHIHFWLLALQHACAAENFLKQAKVDNSDMASCIADAIEMYMKSHVTVKAASTPSSPLDFACSYINLRLHLLKAHHTLMLSCSSFSTKPPPAISMALAATNGQEGTRWVQVVNQLEKCLKEYKSASLLASNLYKSAFDADPASLQNINFLKYVCNIFLTLERIQQSCNCMKSVISTIISTIQTGQGNLGERQFLSAKKNGASSLVGGTLSFMQEISSALDQLLPDTTSSVTISYKLMNMLSWSVAGCVRASPSFPRFFFQTLQNTVIKLAVSPQQGANQEPLLLRADTHLSLKVEGVVQHGERPAFYRKVSSVVISVNTNLISRTTLANTNVKNNEVTSLHLSQTVQPHNDYFTTSFVLPFSVLGIHMAKVEAGVVDENGIIWNTGPRTSLTIKSYDDNVQRQQQMRARAQQMSSTQLTH